MKKVLAVAGLSLVLSLSSFATITKAQAEKKIKEYIGGSEYVSQIKVCETKKYYIGEAILEGYDGINNVVRKVYVSKKDGSILPTMAEHSDYCYMLKK
jgi:hypothetical protein